MSIIKSYHEESDHGSENNMNFLIRQRHKWRNMPSDIYKSISKCVICQKTENVKHNTKNRAISTEHPKKSWEIDLIGPIQSHSGVNKYIIMEIDHFNKWI